MVFLYHNWFTFQAQVNKQNPELKMIKPTGSRQPASPYTSYSQTYPRVSPSLNTQICSISDGKNESAGSSETFKHTIEEVIGEEAPKYTYPVYAQVRKSHSDALRRKSTNLSPEDVKISQRQFGNLCDHRLSPGSRNRHILTNSDKDNANTSQRQFRPKRLTFDENIK
jgi:hypothetical protein